MSTGPRFLPPARASVRLSNDDTATLRVEFTHLGKMRQRQEQLARSCDQQILLHHSLVQHAQRIFPGLNGSRSTLFQAGVEDEPQRRDDGEEHEEHQADAKTRERKATHALPRYRVFLMRQRPRWTTAGSGRGGLSSAGVCPHGVPVAPERLQNQCHTESAGPSINRALWRGRLGEVWGLRVLGLGCCVLAIPDGGVSISLSAITGQR